MKLEIKFNIFDVVYIVDGDTFVSNPCSLQIIKCIIKKLRINLRVNGIDVTYSLAEYDEKRKRWDDLPCQYSENHLFKTPEEIIQKLFLRSTK